MTAVTTFAPGKLFVIGEYAVLSGGRALVVGVDAGIRCTIDRDTTGKSWLRARDLNVDAPLDVAAEHAAARLLAAALRAGTDAFGLAGAFRMEVEGTTAARRKLGLGGSAASVVAILAATAALAGEDPTAPAIRRRLFPLGLEIHRAHQGGRGSGADVAASLFGGWVDFSWRDGRPAIERAAPPAGMRLTAAWSGRARDTAVAIAEFERLPGGEGEPASRLRALLDVFWSAAERGDRGALLDAISAYGDALVTLAGAAPPGPIERLALAARQAGAAAKGSGASGGDSVIAVAFDPGTLTRVDAAWQALGASPLGVSVDELGVRVE